MDVKGPFDSTFTGSFAGPLGAFWYVVHRFSLKINQSFLFLSDGKSGKCVNVNLLTVAHAATTGVL